MQWVIPKAQLDTLLRQYGSPQVEYKKRREYCQKIRAIGKELNLSSKISALSQIIFMRYFLYNSLNSCDPLYVLSASIFLSMKLEDCRTKGIDELKKCCCDQFKEIKRIEESELLLYERKVLVGINFELNIETPHLYLNKLTNGFSIETNLKLDAWAFTNDLCCTHVVLTHTPFCIALLSLCFSSKQHKFDLSYDCDMIRSQCQKLSLKCPEETLSRTGKIHLLEFFAIKAEYVQEAMSALTQFYNP
ncbi:hypothetical protein EHI8A_136370 [Entamoeba histolytica HM-1:IMSS-B]|uniref:Cyclin-like domain-containing protein n=6 Tax=Entamoeba histolytica TaxID=5759 RepID=C4MA26_ENTH1|nr:hypothetical protein EHI_090030 [Entamoeba histolytica HM-1:IMSS]EMD48866.1 cyclin, putative [Entamoeba histolytica KU27]EMH77397.1 hypothetical protein EHI8A_136370 [Entamoeba histolytica HM-1:IMSS-B]EMS13715.1 cyclin, putative [Entamoeba histolytica HM-3:IMSS]ENY64867.1 cyclin, putative [Entamoeba histolytica HM-1:IMSS-A]GAT98602.1 hypothetical protein CL6EHI_090030 [Entamoeba histolytica]|eukprot:XP_648710.2 hypothetical protein EHI_090030 [Entamoeba histolytica HM-1:IMSS]